MSVALFLALLVGLALGLFGGGGSVLSVAILSLGLGMPPKNAIAASLLIIAMASAAALVAQRGTGLVSVRTGIVFGGAGMVGAFAGGRLAALLPEAVLLTAFGSVMLFTSIATLRLNPVPRSSNANNDRPVRAIRFVPLALSIGIITGMVGAGGGVLVVPALMQHGRMPMKRAAATSLVVIALQAFAGFVGQLGQASLDWAIVAPFTLLSTLGSVVGVLLARRAAHELLRRGFVALIILVALVVVGRELPRVAAHGARSSSAHMWLTGRSHGRPGGSAPQGDVVIGTR